MLQPYTQNTCQLCNTYCCLGLCPALLCLQAQLVLQVDWQSLHYFAFHEDPCTPPHLNMFQTMLWPSLAKAGWQLLDQQGMSHQQVPSHEASAAVLAYIAPPDVIAAVQAATGCAPTGPCGSPLAALSLLACAALPVPSGCLQEMRIGLLNGGSAAPWELLAERFGEPPKSKQFVSVAWR
jgi:hypothetical protein